MYPEGYARRIDERRTPDKGVSGMPEMMEPEEKENAEDGYSTAELLTAYGDPAEVLEGVESCY